MCFRERLVGEGGMIAKKKIFKEKGRKRERCQRQMNLLDMWKERESSTVDQDAIKKSVQN